MAEHPGIVLRSGPSGRRASLAGHRLDLWQVVETLRNEGGDVSAAAAYLDLDPTLVEAALAYYRDHAGEIDAQIAENARLAAASEEEWRRRRPADS